MESIKKYKIAIRATAEFETKKGKGTLKYFINRDVKAHNEEEAEAESKYYLDDAVEYLTNEIYLSAFNNSIENITFSRKMDKIKYEFNDGIEVKNVTVTEVKSYVRYLVLDYAEASVEKCLEDLTVEEYNELLLAVGATACPLKK